MKRLLDSGKSFLYIRKRSGPKMEPWGTPVTIGKVSDLVSFTSTNCYLFDKYLFNNLSGVSRMP